MRKLLLITYFYPPRKPDFAGRHAHGLVKYLPQFGWEPYVLTAMLPLGRPGDPPGNVMQTTYDDCLGPFKHILGLNSGDRLMHNVAEIKGRYPVPDFLLRAAGEWLAFPDPQKGWLKHAVHKDDTYEDVDAILSISPPVTSHLIAQQIKKQTGKPWMAYMLDLWSQNHYYQYSHLRKARDMGLEWRTLDDADRIATVSQPLAGRLGAMHERPVYSVPLGYDPDDFTQEDLDKKFTITHTGTIHRGYQDPEPLFVALHELYEIGAIDPDDVHVDFLGPRHEWLYDLAYKHCVKIRQLGTAAHELCLKMQQRSQVLLLLKWNDPGQKGIINSKLSEYLGAKRPILAIGDWWDIVDQVLEETDAGVAPPNTALLKMWLQAAYQEWKQTGEVAYEGGHPENYSRVETARKIGGLCDSMLSS